jgi:uncharacterized protein (TIGR02265 family)
MLAATATETFVTPDPLAPIDLDERIARCPKNAGVKGMFFEAIVEKARARGWDGGRERYVAFRGYPLEEWLEVLPTAARFAHPHVPTREGMRRFGQAAFEVFTSSTAGRVLFSMAGRNVRLAISLAGRAFDVIGSHGSVEILSNEPGRAVLGLRDMWDYIDAWHVGIYEGALTALGAAGTVRVKNHDLSNGDLELTYR